MSLTAFLSRYTAPVAALVREGMTAGSGHWLTIHSDDEGGGTHAWISGRGGVISKGPKSLIGGKLSDFGHHKVTHHPVDHVPAGAKDHPSYTEHPSSQPRPKPATQEGAQDAIKSPGKPYARLHGADQGKGTADSKAGAAGAPASAEEAHSAGDEGLEPLTKEQAEAGLAKARAESTATAAPASSGDADPRDVAATAEFETHKQQVLSQHPDVKAHIDADTSHAGEAERWANNEARTRLSPEHKARGSVTRNAQPYAKPQLPDATATKVADARKEAQDKEAMRAGARRMTEAAVTRGKAMNDPQRADVTRVHAKQAAHSRKPAYDTPRVSDDERGARASSVEGAAWEDRTKALVAQHSGKTPDEMRYVAGNLESQHTPDAKERMAKVGIVPSHPQRVLEEAARRLRQMADAKDAPTAAEKPQDAPKAEAKGDNPKDDFAAKTRAAMAATAAHGPTDYAARDAGRAATHKPRPVTDLASVTKTAPYVAPAADAKHLEARKEWQALHDRHAELHNDLSDSAYYETARIAPKMADAERRMLSNVPKSPDLHMQNVAHMTSEMDKAHADHKVASDSYDRWAGHNTTQSGNPKLDSMQRYARGEDKKRRDIAARRIKELEGYLAKHAPR